MTPRQFPDRATLASACTGGFLDMDWTQTRYSYGCRTLNHPDGWTLNLRARGAVTLLWPDRTVAARWEPLVPNDAVAFGVAALVAS